MNASTFAAERAEASTDWRWRNSSREIGGTSRRETWCWRERQEQRSRNPLGVVEVEMGWLQKIQMRFKHVKRAMYLRRGFGSRLVAR